MIKTFFYILIFILCLNHTNAQETKGNTKEETIRSFVQQKGVPPGNDFVVWRESLMEEMKKKWNISFSEIRVRVVVEKEGSLTQINVISDEWKPTEEMIKELLTIMNAKGKWKPAMHNGEKVRSTYTIYMVFQI